MGANFRTLFHEMVLNHTFSDITEVYINTGYEKQKRKHLDLWGAKLTGILESDRLVSSNVVSIDKQERPQ
jgi:hypothetical protein